MRPFTVQCSFIPCLGATFGASWATVTPPFQGLPPGDHVLSPLGICHGRANVLKHLLVGTRCGPDSAQAGHRAATGPSVEVQSVPYFTVLSLHASARKLVIKENIVNTIT